MKGPCESLLSIDIGTTSVKVGLFDLEGTLVSLSTREYSLATPGDHRVELDVDVYWNAIVEGVREVRTKAGVDPADILALSLSSQGETLVCAGSDGTPLMNAIVWLDARAQAESEELARSFSSGQIYRTTGYPWMAPVWPAAKILWLRNHQPDVFRKTEKFLIIKDYIVHKLTGTYATDLSQSSSTLYLDVGAGDWWDDMLRGIGITRNRLPEIRGSSEVVGCLRPGAAAALDLSPHTLVVTGSMDQIAAAVGAGNVRPGVITESTGTALAVIASVDEPRFDVKGRIPCSAHFRPGLFALMPYAETSGIVLKWFRETFPRFPDRIEGYDELMELAAGIAPGAEGLRAIPHFTGTASPDFNPAARGAFAGISFHHTRAHFVRALVESVAFMLRDNVALLHELSIRPTTIRSLGGAARSDLWCRIKCDTLGVPLEVPLCSESASLGAAIFAGTGAGVFPSVEAAVQRFLRIDRRYEPDPGMVSAYDAFYRDWQSLCARVHPPAPRAGDRP
jgi:xylulokinase